MGAPARRRGRAARAALLLAGGAGGVPLRDPAATWCRGRFPVVCTLRPATARPKLAVLVVGLQNRFYPATTLKRVAWPAARDGFEVHYHLWLVKEAPTELTWKNTWFASFPSVEIAGFDLHQLRSQVLRMAWWCNVSRVSLYFRPKEASAPRLPVDWRRLLGRDSPQHVALLLSLLRFQKIERLWNGTMRQGLQDYRHVVLARDDAFWLADVDMGNFPETSTAYSRTQGHLCELRDGTVPNDGVLVLGGDVAGRLLSLHSAFFRRSSPELDAVRNVESFFHALARVEGIRWHFVPDRVLPFALAMHVQLRPVVEPPTFCLRGVAGEPPEWDPDCRSLPALPAISCDALMMKPK